MVCEWKEDTCLDFASFVVVRSVYMLKRRKILVC
jgi:hypothetical protein